MWATARHPDATVAIGDGVDSVAGSTRTVALSEGVNRMTVTVTAADGVAEQAYTVTVTRAPPPRVDDATLSGLALSDVDFGSFSSAETEYSATVGDGVVSTTVTATPTHPGASVAIGDGVDSVAGSTRTVALTEGVNTVTVTVTAADGVAEQAYTVTVTRAPPPPRVDDATLSGLTLSGVDIGSFSSAVAEYSATAGYAVGATTVTATPTHPGASMAISDGAGSVAGRTRTVALSEGENTVAVTVTAADGVAERTYTVSVTRAPHGAALSGLTLSDVDIGVFSPGRRGYSAEVANAVADTVVAATPFYAGATVAISDGAGSVAGRTRTVALSEGENTVAVTVTAADGVAERTYTVTVRRTESSSPVAGFMWVDTEGGPPYADLGAMANGAVLTRDSRRAGIQFPRRHARRCTGGRQRTAGAVGSGHGDAGGELGVCVHGVRQVRPRAAERRLHDHGDALRAESGGRLRIRSVRVVVHGDRRRSLPKATSGWQRARSPRRAGSRSTTPVIGEPCAATAGAWWMRRLRVGNSATRWLPMCRTAAGSAREWGRSGWTRSPARGMSSGLPTATSRGGAATSTAGTPTTRRRCAHCCRTTRRCRRCRCRTWTSARSPQPRRPIRRPWRTRWRGRNWWRPRRTRVRRLRRFPTAAVAAVDRDGTCGCPSGRTR